MKHILNNMKTVMLRFPPPYCWGSRYCVLLCHVVRYFFPKDL